MCGPNLFSDGVFYIEFRVVYSDIPGGLCYGGLFSAAALFEPAGSRGRERLATSAFYGVCKLGIS